MGALIACCLMPSPNTIPEQAPPSESEWPISSPIGTAHSRFPKSMSKLMRSSPELPGYRPNGDIGLEARTRERSEPSASRKSQARAFALDDLSASGLDVNSPEVRLPPPSYTADNKARRTDVQTRLQSYSSVAQGTSRDCGIH